MNTIKNWMILELSNFVLNGTLDNMNVYTDELILIKNGYAVTKNNIYKLGNADAVWIETEQASEYLKKFV